MKNVKHLKTLRKANKDASKKYAASPNIISTWIKNIELESTKDAE